MSKTYKRHNVHALEKIDLRLTEGGFWAVIGSSGCGKSTLLKIMTGLLSPSEGSVILSGKPVTGPRRDIGMMFQQPTLFPWRTAVENVVLPIEIRDGKKAALEKHDDARALLDLVGLKGFEQVYPNELSGGMAQRVAICRFHDQHAAGLCAHHLSQHAGVGDLRGSDLAATKIDLLAQGNRCRRAV